MTSNHIVASIIDVLTTAHEADPIATNALLMNMIPCNEDLANHPTIPVSARQTAAGECYAVNALGLVNGICDALTERKVAIVIPTKEQKSPGFTDIFGFTEYRPEGSTGPANGSMHTAMCDLESSLNMILEHIRDSEQEGTLDGRLSEIKRHARHAKNQFDWIDNYTIMQECAIRKPVEGGSDAVASS